MRFKHFKKGYTFLTTSSTF
uniref:Uncharacterized protein n=1 Tax=Arundo donax TaxID=35708 RepID=A0A0A9FJC3_ARUDO